MNADDADVKATPPALDTPEDYARFVQLWRLAQVGRCVNPVTHDINNLLGAAMAYAELVGLNKNLGDNERRMLNEIVGAVGKCSRLINDLTAVARPERDSAGAIDPAELLQRAINLRQYDLRLAQIALDNRCAPGTSPIVVDIPKVQLAIVYLLMNAEEALAESPGPRTLRISLESRPEFVSYLFEDTSAGIPEAARARIFQPFATTRGGTRFGLGLSIARAVAEAHGGSLEYAGQAFILTLRADFKRAKG